MKKISVSEATGPVLDWLVAKALGLSYRNDEKYGPMCFRPQTHPGVVHWDSKPLPYSTDWSQGGPIIDREKIELKYMAYDKPPYWGALKVDTAAYKRQGQIGPTPLVAAMRCFVVSKLGDEVEVPEELL